MRRFGAISLMMTLIAGPAWGGGWVTFYGKSAETMVGNSGSVSTYAGGGASDDARNYVVADFAPSVESCLMIRGQLPKEYLGEKTLMAKSYVFPRTSDAGTDVVTHVRMFCFNPGTYDPDFHTLSVGSFAGSESTTMPAQYLMTEVDHGNINGASCEGRIGPLLAYIRICRRGDNLNDDHTGAISHVFTTVSWY